MAVESPCFVLNATAQRDFREAGRLARSTFSCEVSKYYGREVRCRQHTKVRSR